jgi:hypothetical protein
MSAAGPVRSIATTASASTRAWPKPNNPKLASVLHGRAPDALLDIYELERRPIAVLRTIRVSIGARATPVIVYRRELRGASP